VVVGRLVVRDGVVVVRGLIVVGLVVVVVLLVVEVVGGRVGIGLFLLLFFKGGK